MTIWHKFQRGDEWVWAMESPIYRGNSWRDGCEFWTNVLLPEARPGRGDRRFWSFGQSAESAARTGETATDVRLVTLDEWQRGIHGDEKEGK